MKTYSLHFGFGLAALASMAAPLAQAASISGQGTWETTLQSRDFNGDSVVDAYYDTALNITWLKDANFAKTTSFAGADATGRMSWTVAKSWAAGLNVYGVTGWSLPTTVDAPGSAGFSPPPSSSQMAHMYSTTLGNPAFVATNSAGFANLQLDSYWSETAAANAVGPDWAWRFSFETATPGQTCLRCRQSPLPPDAPLFAWAVHTGDVVSPIPEPQTYAMMIAGLCAVGLAVRSKRRRAALV